MLEGYENQGRAVQDPGRKLPNILVKQYLFLSRFVMLFSKKYMEIITRVKTIKSIAEIAHSLNFKINVLRVVSLR